MNRLRAVVLPSLIAGAGAGCSEAEPAPATFQRLRVTPVAGAPAWQAAVVRQRYEPLLELDAWQLEAPLVSTRARLLTEQPFGETPGVLVLGAEKRSDVVRLRRRGDYDTATFNRLRVVGGFYLGATLTVSFLRDGVVLGSVEIGVGFEYGKRRPYPHTPKSHEIAVPAAVRAAGTCDEIELRLEGAARAVRMHAIELVDRSPEAFLPDPGEPPRDIVLATERLRGVGVSDRVPVVTEFVAPARGELLFAYGRPAADGGAARGAAELVLELAVGAGARELRYPVATGGVGWQQARVPLDALAGHAVRARFHLESEVPAACALANLDVVAVSAAPAPTVLLVTTDTHRGDSIGCVAGAAGVATPNLDALGVRGVVFEQCFTWTNTTNPSHIALMTGHHPRDVGIVDNSHALGERARTLAEVFAARGYVTWASVSAMHLAALSGLAQGFDRISGPQRPERRADTTVDCALDWLDVRAGRPLFLWVHVFDAHHPYEPPQGFEMPLLGEPQPVPAKLIERGMEFTDVREALARYRGEIAYLDSELGRLFAAIGSDAAVAVVGDHGESFGEHGFYFTHAGLYPDTLHVPLLLSGPGVGAGGRVTGLVAQADLGRTLLELAGLGDEEFPGQSLLRHVSGRPLAAEPLFALSGHARWASLTADGHHLTLALKDDHLEGTELYAPVRHAVALFDLRRDPDCRVDLVGEQPERARAMRADLVRWLSSAVDLDLANEEDIEVDAAAREALRELGYVGTSSESTRWQEDDCAQCQRFR